MFSAPAAWANENAVWVSFDGHGEPNIHLYFYWSKKCPHCREALPFLDQLSADEPWIVLQSHELTEHPEHVREYQAMAAALGQEARSVPAFFWCGTMAVGYDDAQGMGRFLREQLKNCREYFRRHENAEVLQPGPTAPISLPFLGDVEGKQWSLPAYTIILAGLDAFNPCAFFVLLFLLSLLVHAGSRARMLTIGGIFVFFSGLLYFVFMAAWLNVFLWIGNIDLITSAAGAVAVVIAVINIKDYFWFKRGVSLSIPESAKPGLFRRMRNLVNTGNQTAMIAAAIGLAAFANLYEFLCTAGFPMVFTRILTLHELSASAYYLYLLFYNLIYVVPLLVIVILFSVTLGAKKLQEEQGRLLKLMAGMMMLGLGLVLLIDANWLNDAGIAFALLALALLVTAVVATIERRFRL
jgi:glutaredoxin